METEKELIQDELLVYLREKMRFMENNERQIPPPPKGRESMYTVYADIPIILEVNRDR